MLFFPRAVRAGSTVPATRIHTSLILSPLVLLLSSLPTANAESCTTDPNNTAVVLCPRSSSSQTTAKSGLPRVVILTIAAAVLFFLIIGGLLSHFYLRKRRERKKRDEHRWKVWQFKDMQRTSQPPLATTRTIPTTFPSSSEITLVPSRAPTHVTFPTQMSETAATGPKYPVKIYGAGFNGV